MRLDQSDPGVALHTQWIILITMTERDDQVRTADGSHSLEVDQWCTATTRSGSRYDLLLLEPGTRFDTVRVLRFSRETQSGPFRCLADLAINAYMRTPARVEPSMPLEIIRAPFADEQRAIVTSPVIAVDLR